MTKQQLIDKLSDIEWEDFEVKAAQGGLPKSSWATVSAFSNTGGGWLVFGISEKKNQFEVLGVSNPEKLEHEFLNTLNIQKFNVRISADAYKYKFFNPGNYPKPIEYFLHHDISIPRNPIIAKLFRAIKLAENAGYGFDKMIDGWNTYSEIPIEFQTDLDTSTTIFYLPADQATEQATEQASDQASDQAILIFCKKPSNLS